MGVRSRQRRARRAWLIPLLLPVLRALRAWVQWLSCASAARLARVLAWLLRTLKPGRARVTHNLSLVLGRPISWQELARFERAYYLHLAQFMLEWLRMPLITRANFREWFAPGGEQEILQLQAEGQGLILVASHAGLWELAGHLGGLVGLRLTTPAKLSGYEDLDRWVCEIREAAGQRIVDARGSLWGLKKALDRGEAVGINGDQEARKNAVFVPFLGLTSSTVATPAQLHRRTGAPIVVVSVHRLEPFRRYRLEVATVIRDRRASEEELTARVNQGVEAAIRNHPEQWLWSHRRWRLRPPGLEGTPFELDPRVPPLDLSRVGVA